MPNFGSFGSALGGSDAIRAALDRRSGGGGSVPALSQMSGGAPGGGSIPPAPPTSVPQQGGAPGGGGPAPPLPESQLIIKALSDRLKKIGDIEAPKPPTQTLGGAGV